MGETFKNGLFEILGGPGSGNFGHAGRPGKVGGSSSGGFRKRITGDWWSDPKQFSQLPKDVQATLKKSGVSAKEWDKESKSFYSIMKKRPSSRTLIESFELDGKKFPDSLKPWLQEKKAPKTRVKGTAEAPTKSGWKETSSFAEAKARLEKQFSLRGLTIAKSVNNVKYANWLGGELSRLHNDFGGIERSGWYMTVKSPSSIKLPGAPYPCAGGYNRLYADMRLANRPQGSNLEHFMKYPYRSVTGDARNDVFRHEFCHHIYYNAKGPKFKADVSRLFRSTSKVTIRMKISDYATTNPSEFFSEVGTVYFNPGYKKGMLPKNVDSFMRKNFPRKKG